MEKRSIKSEGAHLWSMVKHLLLLPVTFLQVLFRKKKTSELFLLPKILLEFCLEARATLTLIAMNVLVFFGVQGYLMQSGIITTQALENLVWRPSYLLMVDSQNALRLIVSFFLHADISHLLGNMLFLLILGRVVERHLGTIKTLMVYLGCGIVSFVVYSLVHIFIVPQDVGVIGASGAISGLAAFAILLDPFYFTYLVVGIPLPIFIVGWLQVYLDVTGFLSPGKSNVAYGAHLGGYLAVTLIGFMVGGKEKKKLWKGFLLNLALLGFLAILAFIGLLYAPSLEIP